MDERLINNVVKFEHPRETDPADLNWDAIRILLRLAQTGSFRAASKQTGLAVNTIRSHIKQLERKIGAPLVVRGAGGIEMTPDGERVCQIAQGMEEAAFNMQRAAGPQSFELRGEVRVSVTEGLGAFWIIPHATRFQRENPKLIMELNCTMRPADPVRLESDVAIQISRPENPALKAVKLGTMHAMPFASPQYLETYGRPTSVKDIERHRIVEQLAPQLFNDEVDALFPGVEKEGFIAVRTNTSTAHYWAVADGAGLGMLPTYVSALGAPVVPLEDIEIRSKFEIWMSFHPDTGDTPRIAAARKWLKQTFSAKKYPWFRDDLVLPSDFGRFEVDIPIPNPLNREVV